MIKKLNITLSFDTQNIIKWTIVVVTVLIWLAIQTYYFQNLGLKIVPDSARRYIPAAVELVENGSLSSIHEYRYIMYVAFLSLFIITNLNLKLAAILQICISGVAAIYLYKSVQKLSNNSLVALGAAYLFIFWKDIQLLNVYILTESLFISSIIFVLFAIVRSEKLTHYLLALALSIIPTFLRPNGFIILLGVTICIIYHYRNIIFYNKTFLWIGITALSTVSLYILDQYLLKTFGIISSYAKGEVIYASNYFSVSTKGLTIPVKGESPLLNILAFIYKNPIFFLKLFLTKLFVFILYAKPYYSNFHNLAIILTIYPLYFFCTLYILKTNRQPAKVFLITVLFLQTIMVAVTTEDWDCRFIAPLLPILIAFGFTGFYNTLQNNLKIGPQVTPISPNAPENRHCPAARRYARPPHDCPWGSNLSGSDRPDRRTFCRYKQAPVATGVPVENGA